MATPEVAFAQCNTLLELIAQALKHPRIPAGRHSRRNPPPVGFEAIYSRLFILYEDREFEVFAEPVNAIKHNIPQYHTIIQQPMSLRTILDNIVNGNYPDVRQVERDVDLIRTNSDKFNGAQSPITLQAEFLKNRLVDEMRRASPEDLTKFQDLIQRSDEDSMQRAFHAIKTETPNLVLEDDAVDLDQMHKGLVYDVIRMLEQPLQQH